MLRGHRAGGHRAGGHRAGGHRASGHRASGHRASGHRAAGHHVGRRVREQRGYSQRRGSLRLPRKRPVARIQVEGRNWVAPERNQQLTRHQGGHGLARTAGAAEEHDAPRARERKPGPVLVQRLLIPLAGALSAGDDPDPALPAVDPVRGRSVQGALDRRDRPAGLAGRGRLRGTRRRRGWLRGHGQGRGGALCGIGVRGLCGRRGRWRARRGWRCGRSGCRRAGSGGLRARPGPGHGTGGGRTRAVTASGPTPDRDPSRALLLLRLVRDLGGRGDGQRSRGRTAAATGPRRGTGRGRPAGNRRAAGLRAAGAGGGGRSPTKYLTRDRRAGVRGQRPARSCSRGRFHPAGPGRGCPSRPS